MEFYYYDVEAGWINDEYPKRVFIVEKSMSDPTPEFIINPNDNKKVLVKRYYDKPPAMNMNNPNAYGYQGKYKKIVEQRRDAMARLQSTGKTAPELAREMGLGYRVEGLNPLTGKKESTTKYITESNPTTAEWERIPKEARERASKAGLGFQPQKDFESPAIGFGKHKRDDFSSVRETKKYNDIQQSEEEFNEMEVIYIGKI